MERIMLLKATMGVDSAGRIINTIRRGKVRLQEVMMWFKDDYVSMQIKLEGSENEIDWLYKKLFKLVDVDEVKVV
jgi:acetolactate synthase regulatory subunit